MQTFHLVPQSIWNRIDILLLERGIAGHQQEKNTVIIIHCISDSVLLTLSSTITKASGK